MKVDVSRDVQTNIQGAVDFKVSENAYKIFSMLSNYLYSDKEFAVLYELSANAHDEHVISGKADVPFDVTIPTRLDSKLRIRDYGRGLCEPDVTRLLATYGESTKTGTNMAIGGWGIGFKSVAAVSNTWNVVSYHDGIRKDYLIFINEQGIPALTKIKETPTEETGIEIIIPIPADKISTWENLVTRVYKHFPVKPNFTNKQVQFKSDAVITSGTGWRLRSQSNYYGTDKAVYICSHREYAVDINKVDPKYGFLLNLPFSIDFAIGELELSISREQLQYTKHTVDAINAKLKCVYDDLIKKITDILATATDELHYRELVFASLKQVFLDKYNLNNSVVARLVREAINGKYGISSIPEDINNVYIPITGRVQAFNGTTLSECKVGWYCWKTHFVYYSGTLNGKDAKLRIRVNALDKLDFYQRDVKDGAARIRGNHTQGKYMFLFEQTDFPDIFKGKVRNVSLLPKKPRQQLVRQTRSGDYYVLYRNSYDKVKYDPALKYAYIYTGNFRDQIDLEQGLHSYTSHLMQCGYKVIAIKKGDSAPAGVRHVKDEVKHLLEEIKKNPLLKNDAVAYMVWNMFSPAYNQKNLLTLIGQPEVWKVLFQVETTNSSVWNDLRTQFKEELDYAQSKGFSTYRIDMSLTQSYNKLAKMLNEPEIQHTVNKDLVAAGNKLYSTYPLFKYYGGNWDVADIKSYVELVGK